MTREQATPRFVGAGLALWSTGFGIDVPIGSISHGLRIVQHLSVPSEQCGPDVVRAITHLLDSKILKSNTDRDEVDRHLAALPELMDDHRLCPSLLNKAQKQAEHLGLGESDFGHLSQFVASEFSRKVRETEALAIAKLEAPLTHFLVSWLFSGLLENHHKIIKLRGEFCALFDTGIAMPAAHVLEQKLS